MRAVVIQADRSLAALDLPAPEPGPGMATLRVEWCGICGSDLHMRSSEFIPAGAVLGHECAGVVDAVGDDVAGWRPGDRAVVFPFAPCGACPVCRAGRPNLCASGTRGGVGQGATPGGFAERVLVASDQLVAIPDALETRAAALVEPLAVGVHGAELARPEVGARVCVVGAGPIGVMTAYALRARGVEDLHLVEPRPERRARAVALGFDAIDVDAASARFGDHAPGAVVECAGHPQALGLAVELAAPAATVVALGVHMGDSPISQVLLISKELELRGGVAYMRRDFEIAIGLLRAGAVPADQVITAMAALDEADAWFTTLSSPDHDQMKVLLRP